MFIYDIIFSSDVSFLFFLLFEIPFVGFFNSSFKHRTIESHVPKLIAFNILGLRRNLLLSSFIIIPFFSRFFYIVVFLSTIIGLKE